VSTNFYNENADMLSVDLKHSCADAIGLYLMVLEEKIVLKEIN
jgi:hypothetical protein